MYHRNIFNALLQFSPQSYPYSWCMKRFLAFATNPTRYKNCNNLNAIALETKCEIKW